jgi:hypothetical protein
MSSLRTWAAGSVIVALILLSPMIAFLMVLVAEMQIDLLMEAGTRPTAPSSPGAIGWVLYRKFWPHPKVTPQWELEQEPDEAAIAAPQR